MLLRRHALSGQVVRDVGVPNRTSYELHLPAEMSAWYSGTDF